MAEYKITNRVRDKTDRVYWSNRGIAFVDELIAGTNGILYDNQTSGQKSIDWFNRELYDSSVYNTGVTTNKYLYGCKDSTVTPSFFKFYTYSISANTLTSARNDGAMNSFLWTDANGVFKRSPIPAPTQGVSRSFNTAFQVSTTKSALVTYTVEISSVLTLTSGQTGRIYLEISPNNSTWTEVSHVANSNTGTLSLGINTTQIGGGVITGYIPQGYYVRLRTNGTSTFTYSIGQEVVMF